MCGIAGLLQHDARDAAPVAQLHAMQDALAHRGPDGRGTWLNGPVGLAHTRLALVGLASGAQPLSNEDGQLQLVLNGEIYNHRALRHQLQQRGHRFASDSDAEVVLHLYEEQGAACLHLLNGPFALALWDGRRQQLFLARDRFGMRPLYWAQRPGAWAFASEIKALLALPDMPRRPDWTALSQTFGLWSPVAPRTAFAGIQSLMPGEWMQCQAGPGLSSGFGAKLTAPKLQRWWDLHWHSAGQDSRADSVTSPHHHGHGQEHGGFEAAARQLARQLQEATALQLQADVPVGVYLSGGLDSSAIAALAAEQARAHGHRLQAFALGFEDAAFDESAQQDAVAQALGLHLERITVGREALAEDFERLVWHAETPLVRTAAAPMMRLARLARQNGVKAVLSGEGADELLGGYDLFKELRVRRLMAGGSAAWRPAALRRLYPYLTQGPGAAGGMSARWWATSQADLQDPWLPLRGRLQAGQRFASLLQAPWQAGWADRTAQAMGEWQDQLPPDFMHWPWLGRAQYLECKGLLAGYLLSSQGDRVAMAEGLELRHPYLDHRLAEAVSTQPSAWHLRGLRDKRLLREAMRPWLPEALRQRTKQPYRAPGASGLMDAKGLMPAALEALVSPDHLRAQAWLDTAAATRLLSKCRQGRAVSAADNQAFVGLMSLLSWQRQFGVDMQAPPA